MKREVGLSMGQEFISKYANVCTKIEIAGSIRRQVSEVKDIEIVALPSYPTNLFGNPDFGHNTLFEAIRANGELVIKGGKPGGKYAQINDASRFAINDVFCATPRNYGWIMAIRTGSADFSYGLAARNRSRGYALNDGMPHIIIGWDDVNDKPLLGTEIEEAFETEESVFEFLEMEFVPPELRTDKSVIQKFLKK